MREVMFRAKSWHTGEYVYGSLIKRKDGVYIIVEKGADSEVVVDPTTIGQFTGMKDCDNKPIF